MKYNQVHIGGLVKARLKEKNITIVALTKFLGFNQSSVIDLFKRKDVHPKLLRKISTFLEYDFFRYYLSAQSELEKSNVEFQQNLNQQSQQIETQQARIEELEKLIEILTVEKELLREVVGLRSKDAG